MPQKQAERARTKKAEDVPEVEPKALETTGSIDDILGDIDDVLEENALEFVRSYIQRGGQ